MSISLAGKHCAIVGATGVIGSHIASAFARQGAVLTLLSRSAVHAQPELEPQLQAYKAPSSRSSTGANVDGQRSLVEEGVTFTKHRFMRLDVSDTASLPDVFRSPPRQHHSENVEGDDGASAAGGVGPVDVLVNCAGVSQTSALKRTSDVELQQILHTNLLSTMLICKHARMRSKGCIINVSSLMATKGGRGATAYAASKAGLIGFTRALCLEMSNRSIRANALLPGWVESPMWNHLKPQLKQDFLADIPLGRIATPDEVADAAVFLAANGYANNCILNLDGGLSAL